MDETILGFLVIVFIDIVFLVITILISRAIWRKDFETMVLEHEVKPIQTKQQPTEPQGKSAEELAIERKREDLENQLADLNGKNEPTPTPVERTEPIEVKEEKIEPEQIFKCPKCNKEFKSEQKLQRHYGMAHYKEIEIN